MKALHSFKSNTLEQRSQYFFYPSADVTIEHGHTVGMTAVVVKRIIHSLDILPSIYLLFSFNLNVLKFSISFSLVLQNTMTYINRTIYKYKWKLFFFIFFCSLKWIYMYNGKRMKCYISHLKLFSFHSFLSAIPFIFWHFSSNKQPNKKERFS